MEYNCTDREKKGKDRGAEDFMCIIIGGEEMGDFHVFPTFLCNYHHFTFFLLKFKHPFAHAHV